MLSKYKAYFIICAVIAVFAAGFFTHVFLAQRAALRTVAEAEAYHDIATAAHARSIAAFSRSQELAAENERLSKLSLALAAKFDGITHRYEGFNNRIASADRITLLHFVDSLLAGYSVNRERYNLLLRERPPFDSGGPVDGQ